VCKRVSVRAGMRVHVCLCVCMYTGTCLHVRVCTCVSTDMPLRVCVRITTRSRTELSVPGTHRWMQVCTRLRVFSHARRRVCTHCIYTLKRTRVCVCVRSTSSSRALAAGSIAAVTGTSRWSPAEGWDRAREQQRQLERHAPVPEISSCHKVFFPC